MDYNYNYNYNGHTNKSQNQTSHLQESSKNKEDSDLEKSSLEAEGVTAAKQARVTNPGFERHGYVGARIACSFGNPDRIVHAKKKIIPYEPFDSPCDPVPNHVSHPIELLRIHIVLIVLAVAIILLRHRKAEN